jgi:XTP/dITP diphosphohydrolase
LNFNANCIIIIKIKKELAMKILFASNNQDKVDDVKRSFKIINNNVEVLGLKEANINIEVEETKKKLLENAKLKARAVYSLLTKNGNNTFDYIIGEDFGFFVEAFPKVAGVYAKRWLEGNNKERAAAIVELFNKTGEKNKTATFVCAMAAINKIGEERYSVGKLKGEIGEKMPTQEGFGYHQIVKMPDGRYLNEYSLEEKSKIWSRHKALEQLKLI